MAVRAATRLDSPLQGPNLPVLVPARIFPLPFVDQLLLVKYPQSHIDVRLLKADDTTTFVGEQAAVKSPS